ncbi:MAG: hypothetical protein ABEH64_12995 [Salinirussus sp.]
MSYRDPVPQDDAPRRSDDALTEAEWVERDQHERQESNHGEQADR